MKVQAKETGTHYLIDDRTQRPEVGLHGIRAEIRHREGDVFELKPYWVTLTDPASARVLLDEDGKPKMRLLTAEEQFSERSMIRVEDDTPESFSTAQDAVDRSSQELRGGRNPKRNASKIAEVHG